MFMKKFFFMAAMASVALASCVNDVSDVAAEQQKEITFASPVVGNLSRAVAGEIATGYNIGEIFTVYAWYCTEAAFNPTNSSVYINGISTTYDSTLNKDDDAGTGTWKLVSTYYWPKNGKLTFSAYSPSIAKDDMTVSYHQTNGFTFENYTVNNDVTQQYDLLYSDRAYNKTTSTGEVNTQYDGVDIQFRHALSSIHVNVETDKEAGTDYPSETITVNKIWFENVYKSATFKELLTLGTESESLTTSAWSAWYNEGEMQIGSTNQAVTYESAQYGTTALLIPQAFDHNSSTKHVTLKVNYTIKNGDGTTIAQQAVFDLTESANQGKVDGGAETTIAQWTKGYKYTYNIVIGLKEIYLAPSVVDWGTVDIGGTI